MAEQRRIGGSTLASQWDSYRTVVVPANASKEQLLETKRAFYAGAAAFFNCTEQATEPDVPEEQCMRMLDILHGELQQYAEGLIKGPG